METNFQKIVRKSLSWNVAKEWLDINNADQVLRIFNKISKDNA